MTSPQRSRSHAAETLPEINALALLDLAPVLGRDLHDHIIYWGGGAQALYGFTAEEALGRVSHELLTTSFPKLYPDIHRELLRVGRWEGELSHVRKNGTTIIVSSQWVLHRNAQHQPCAILEVNHDITARKQAELAKANLAAIVENSPDAIIGEDLDGNIVSWNPGAEAIFGYTPVEVLGRHISMLATPENAEDALDMIERAKKGQVVKRIAAERIRKDGTHLFVSLAICPVYDRDGNLVGLAKMAHDITDIRQAQQALQLSQAQLAKANEDLERIVRERTAKLRDALTEVEHFSHTITHDLRGPLRTLQGFGSLLLEEWNQTPTDEIREHIERIAAAARKMDLLITDALEYSRAAREELPLSVVQPAHLLETTISAYPHLQPHRASIRVEGTLPPVQANPTGLVQCFANLLGNAVKFVSPGVVPSIQIFAERRGDCIRIWIQDNGIGIPKAVQPKLFSMFQRGNTDYEGTGIGLALVKRVLEKMGGTTGVESEPGQGSRFWIELLAAN